MQKIKFNEVVKRTQQTFIYDNKNFALPRFPTVYQLDLPNHKYTKQYDHFYELYFETERLIGRDEIFIYNYLQSLANRGLILRLKEFALFVEMDYHKLIKALDCLEDCLLIHRVNRLDLRGKPNDLVIHLPATYKEWKEGRREKIIDRVKTEVTRLSRVENSIEKQTDEGKTRRYNPRTNGKFHFDYKKIFKRTFKDETHAEHFAKSILRHFYDAKNEIIKDAKKFDHSLRQIVKESFAASNLNAEEKHYNAALTMRKIYAPVMSEF